MKPKPILTLGTVVLAGALVATHAEAGNKKSPGKRSEYSEKQQKEFFNEALKLCRKKYGQSLHTVEVDYYHRRYVCYVYG